MHRLFVYGTLKKGKGNHGRILSGYDIKITPAWTYGKLYDLGWYPALTQGNNKVYGELLEFDDQEILQKIDRLEGFKSNGNRSNFYKRENVTVYVKDRQPLQAWVYLLTKSQIREIGGLIIPMGRW